MTSLFLTSTSYQVARRLLAGLVVVSWLPDVTSPWWATPIDPPAFLEKGTYKHYLSAGESVLVLPLGGQGNSALWQAQTNMYFRTASGYQGPTPTGYLGEPMIGALWSHTEIPACEQLRAFLASHDTSAVLLADRGKHSWSMVSGVSGRQAPTPMGFASPGLPEFLPRWKRTRGVFLSWFSIVTH